MVTPQLGNCSKCGKLFLKVRDYCNDCYHKEEEDYLKVASYLREHQGVTIQELSDETMVSIAQIRHFILIGRIITGSFPNLTYPCETCGQMINTGRTCSNCMKNLSQLNLLNKKANGQDSLERNGKSGGYITNYLK